MPLIAIQSLWQIGMFVLKYLVDNYIHDQELKKQFYSFAEIARNENIKSIVRRSKDEDQLIANAKKWDEINAAKAKDSKK